MYYEFDRTISVSQRIDRECGQRGGRENRKTAGRTRGKFLGNSTRFSAGGGIRALHNGCGPVGGKKRKKKNRETEKKERGPRSLSCPTTAIKVLGDNVLS